MLYSAGICRQLTIIAPYRWLFTYGILAMNVKNAHV